MVDQSDEQLKSLGPIREVRAAIFAQRSTILISLFAAGALAFPPVTREIYRILADDAYHLTHEALLVNPVQGIRWLQIGFFFLTLLLASATIWFVGRDLSWQLQRKHLDAPGVRGFLLRWLPIVCAMFLPLGAAWGVYQTTLDIAAISSLPHRVLQPGNPTFPSPMSVTQQDLDRLLASMGAVSEILRYGVYLCLILTVVLLGWITWVDWFRRRPFSRSMRYVLLLIAVSIVALLSLYQIGPPRVLGTIALFNLFIIALALFVGRGIYINDRFGIPVLLIAVAAAVLFSVLDLNDNHVVPTAFNQNSRGQTSANHNFRMWLQSRADRAAYQSQPYPVFIVSAAGGGLYAAEHTARFLARIQDHCPHFAQHIFAISGVSGGSVGAALFASLVSTQVKQQTDTPRCSAFEGAEVKSEKPNLEQSVDFILGKDYLSPIVAATLFPDFLQRFLPFSVARFDRGRILDDALEAAWRERFGSKDAANPLEMPMMDLWDPTGVTPSLLLNATHVATGGRFVAAPFYPRRGDQVGIKLEWLQGHLQNSSNKVQKTNGHEDLKLSTAAGISARFPWIMPAATVNAPKQNENRKNTLLRLVDGGYFENSGAETAADLIRAITVDNEKDWNYRIYVLALTGYDDSLFGGNFDDQTPLSEFISPIRGLLNTRQARGDLTIIRTLDFLCPDLDNCNRLPDDRDWQKGWHNRARWVFAALDLKDDQLPLSWHLSESTRWYIRLHAGTPSDCGNTRNALVPLWSGLPERSAEYGVPPPPPRVLAALNSANCAASVICGQLANRKLAFATGDGQMENYCTSWDASAQAPAPALPATQTDTR